MELLRPVQKEIAITVHLNIIEGRICSQEDVPLMTYPKDIHFLTSGYRRKETSLFMRDVEEAET